MDVAIKLDLCRAIRAFGNAGFLNLDVRQVRLKGRAIIKFSNRSGRTCTGPLNRSGVATMVADKQALGWIKPEIRSAIVARKTVVRYSR